MSTNENAAYEANVSGGKRTMPPQKPGRSKQNYGTPYVFIDAVFRLLHIEEFARDLAAEPHNTVCERYYTKEDNALVQPWGRADGKSMWVTGEWNWLNPEFSRINPWVGRAYGQAQHANAQTAVLVPAGVGSNWWRDWVHEKARVLFLNGRITFEGVEPNPKTGKIDAYPKDCALLLYGPAATPGYSVWSWNAGS